MAIWKSEERATTHMWSECRAANASCIEAEPLDIYRADHA